ncbi:MAG: phospholipase [Alphaproteobacteria bacterium]|jgi:phospholipase D1/2|nr:phospholipase [Alphaproteobacteria bacterium]
MGTLRQGHNAWRIEEAKRASVLIDAGAYFSAVRSALKQAQRNVFIIGWDLDSRTKLVGGDGEANDGWPVNLRDFLTHLVRERPQLTVHLLAWDFAVLYALEREPFPSLKLGWNTPSRVRFRLDNVLPVGASHHQKIVVIDDAVAFSGGLDLTIRRWDTNRHRIDDPRRLDPAGRPYRPFHDVQMVVDGDAAGALAELARERWARATGEDIPRAQAGSPWPQGVAPDFTNTRLAIARTRPAHCDMPEAREVEALFHDMIASAERSLYIENQFLTSAAIAQALAQRMQENPELETVIVAPHTPTGWLEAHTMRNGRIRFMRILRDAGVGGRVRLLYPEVCDGQQVTHTMVHSKVMIVDDRLLRVGSANMNNRSMGTDTECDLAIEADCEAHASAIRAIRARLLGDHCGVPEEVAAHAIELGSLIGAAETLSGQGHRLLQIDDGEPDHGELAEYIEGLADPERPIQSREVIAGLFGEQFPRRTPSVLLKLAAFVTLFVSLTIAWHYPPLSTLANPSEIGPMLRSLAAEPWAPLLVMGIYLVGGLIAFPITVLIAATAAAFGPAAGLAYATAGSLLSAIVTYTVGAVLGRETLRGVLGSRLRRVQHKIVSGGVLAVAAIRLVPLAPFTVVNLVAGASEVKLGTYVAGTLLGMAPGLIVMSALGHQFVRILSEPRPGEFAILIVVLLSWLAVAGCVQLIVAKFGK